MQKNVSSYFLNRVYLFVQKKYRKNKSETPAASAIREG